MQFRTSLASREWEIGYYVPSAFCCTKHETASALTKKRPGGMDGLKFHPLRRKTGGRVVQDRNGKIKTVAVMWLSEPRCPQPSGGGGPLVVRLGKISPDWESHFASVRALERSVQGCGTKRKTASVPGENVAAEIIGQPTQITVSGGLQPAGARAERASATGGCGPRGSQSRKTFGPGIRAAWLFERLNAMESNAASMRQG